VLDIDQSFPEYAQVLLVARDDRRISISFVNIQRGGFSAIWAGGDLNTFVCVSHIYAHICGHVDTKERNQSKFNDATAP